MIISVVFLFLSVVLMTILVLLYRFMIVSNTIDVELDQSVQVNYGCDILLTLLSFLLQFMARLTKSVENE